jgi:hypothetical protein
MIPKLQQVWVNELPGGCKPFVKCYTPILPAALESPKQIASNWLPDDKKQSGLRYAGRFAFIHNE